MKKYRRMLVSVIIILVFMLSVPLTFGGETSKIDINKATVEQLMEIKGIGQKYAERIVEYRTKNGPFKKVEDLQQVKGIGSKTLESIKDLVMVTPAK